MNQKIIAFNKAQREKVTAIAALPELRAGDIVKIYRRIKEGTKTRTQMFQGMIIAINGGQSSSRSITVRKVSSGVGVELILPLNSTQIEKIEFIKRTRARRSKLYFVRDKSVKVLSKKLKEIPLAASVVAYLEKMQSKSEAPAETDEVASEEVSEESVPEEIAETPVEKEEKAA